MPIGTKLIKKRIASIKNTKKMTKAMEMVSAAKMRKSVTAAQRTRLFTALTRQLVSHLPQQEDMDEITHELMSVREVKKTLLLLITSNRGLCGSYNANIMKETKKMISTDSSTISVLGVGKKAAIFAKRFGYPLIGVYEEFSDKPEFEKVLTISSRMISEYAGGVYDRILVAYTDFRSPVLQEVFVRQLLPLTKEALSKYEVKSSEDKVSTLDQYVYEPSRQEILDEALPRLVEVLLYQMILESSASEHSSRMVAMKSATDNANELVDDLTLTYNKARQAAITQEISEIVGGAVALE